MTQSSVVTLLHGVAARVAAKTPEQSLEDLLDPMQPAAAVMRRIHQVEAELANLVTKLLTVMQVCADPCNHGCSALGCSGKLLEALRAADPVRAVEEIRIIDAKCEECRYRCPAHPVAARLIELLTRLAPA